ncbi:MAG: glycosyltransferase family 9 protein [Spirochaetes bacterium]|nr:glycosyltransferase family 9 protein [Spirochaetota bacterium]
MLSPSVKALKKKFPRSFIMIDVLKTLPVASLWKNNPYIDKIYNSNLTYNPRYWNPLAYYLKDFWIIRNEIKELVRTYRITRVYFPKSILTVFQKIERNALTAGWPNRFFRKIFLSHVVHKIYRLAGEMDLDLDDPRTELYLKKNDMKQARAFLKKCGISKKDILIGLHRTSGDDRKNWDIDEAQVFCDMAVQKFKAKCIIFNGPRSYEEEFEKEGKHITGKNIYNMVTDPPLDILSLASLIKSCDVMVATDSGPGHMADAMDVPLVSLFIDSPSEYVGPLGKKTHLLCSPRGNPRLRLIKAQKVFKIVADILK